MDPRLCSTIPQYSIGNKAAYGRLLITGGISNELYLHGLNENTNSVEDYVQQEFIGEHNLYIKDMVVTGQNSISDNSWYYSKLNQSSEDGEYNMKIQRDYGIRGSQQHANRLLRSNGDWPDLSGYLH